jgi:hypothetical protein
MNEELRSLFAQDQADRTEHRAPDDLKQRDRVRRRRVEDLIAGGALQTPEDYYHAAIIFQHANPVVNVILGSDQRSTSIQADEDSLRCYWRAHELASRAAELGYTRARWLAAAAFDRWLMFQGKPQKYGTQFWQGKLWDVDPTTTDAERSAWNVRPLAELRTLPPGESTQLRPLAGPAHPPPCD